MAEWIEWSGGDCPVDLTSLVDTKADDGRVDHAILASDVPWDSWISIGAAKPGEGCDIVAYRLSGKTL